MRKSLFLVLAAALASTCAFAVDGVVLINQSTVMAAGGFPYTITQSGSYRLSGDLTPPLNVDAIHISTSNVSLDLNGFTISCSFTPPGGVNCITDGFNLLRKIAIRNGAIDVSQVGTGTAVVNPFIAGVKLSASNAIAEELQVEVHVSLATGLLFTPPTPLSMDGINLIVRHNILRGDNNGIFAETVINCPGVIVENVLNLLTGNSSFCTVVNNVDAH